MDVEKTDKIVPVNQKFSSSPHLSEMATEDKIIPDPIPSLNTNQKSNFNITPQDLSDMVNFDNRNSSSLLELLIQHGGLPGIAQKLRTNLEQGLAVIKRPKQNQATGKDTKNDNVEMEEIVSDVDERLLAFGENIIRPPKPRSIGSMVLENVKQDTIIQVLLVGAAVTLIIGTALDPSHGWYEGLAIVVAVLIVLTITAGNDWSKEKKFRKLLLLQSDKKVKVIRNGQIDEISSWNLLVGDIVELVPGDEVPADGLFISGNHLVIDESPLTGETIPCKKSDKSPYLFSGCQVSEGTGRILVTAVGPRSSGGQIQAMLNEKQGEATPLQLKLRVVALQIGKIGIASGILTFVGLLIRWAIDKANTAWDNKYLLQLLDFFITGVTIVVVAVPEGLPLAVAIALGFSMFKMIKDKCFVRQLAASETMGEATCVCTDKTGTLTENRMTVVKYLNSAGIFNGEGSAADNAKPYSEFTFPKEYRDLLAEGVSSNSTCFVKTDEQKKTSVFVGSATEGALLVFISKLGSDYSEIRKVTKKVENGELTFSSDKKRMATAVYPQAQTSTKAKFRFHVKGASEIVLKLCTKIHDSATGSALTIADSKAEEIQKIISEWASEGLRTLVLAYKDTEDEPIIEGGPDQSANIDTDLVFLGLAGIKDPIRKEVPNAVLQCQQAGLIVRMVTGDNVLTAKKIATECGILKPGGLCIEGPVFRAMSEEEKKRIIPDLQVLARSSPADKFILVSLLKGMGEVVAVTGDGTNDAPALKEADVGFAMGISGTQIAMNASDIMLLDDNFASIVQSIRWGRNVFDVIRKFLQFQLAVNLAAILITFFGSVSTQLYEAPLTAVQLLWINLIMDSLGALALASDDPDEDVLQQPPHKKSERVINLNMIEYILAVTFYEFTVVMLVLLGGYQWFGVQSTDRDGIHALVFSIFVLMQVVNLFLTRQLNHELNFLRGVGKNKIFLSMVAMILVVQVIAVQLGGEFVNSRPLSAVQWGYSTLAAVILIPYMLLVRISLRVYDRFNQRKIEQLHPGSPAGSPKSISGKNQNDYDPELGM